MFVHSSPITLKMSKCQFLQQFYLLQNTKTPIPYILRNFGVLVIYQKPSSYSVKEKKHTHTSVFSDDFTQKVPLYPRKITRFRPLQRFRLVIPDPFLSVRRAIGTRFYAPPRVAGSVSRRFHATPWFGSGFGPPGEWRWHHNSHESPR